METSIGTPERIDEAQVLDNSGKPIYQGKKAIIYIGERDQVIDADLSLEVIYGILTTKVIFPEEEYFFPVSRKEKYNMNIHKRHLKEEPTYKYLPVDYSTRNKNGNLKYGKFRKEVHKKYTGLDLIDWVDYILPDDRKGIENGVEEIGARFAGVIHREKMNTLQAIVLNKVMRERDFGPFNSFNMPGEKLYKLDRPLEERLEKVFLNGLKSAKWPPYE